MNRRFWIVWVAVLTAVTLGPSLAVAQETNTIVEPDKPVDAKYVGIAGGAIAGAEFVVVAQAIFGVNKTWPYLTFPLLGAGAGGVGGYFLEQESPKGSVALLIGSMALIIPTAIAASSATAYNPEDETGVLVEAEEDEIQFSFEADPQTSQPRQAPTTTEVEARPPPTLPQSSESQEEPDSAPETAPDEETPGPQSASNDREQDPESDRILAQTYVVKKTSTNKRTERPVRNPSAGPAVVGAVFNVSSDGSPRFSVPAIDLRPSSVSEEEALLGLKPALEIYLPLLSVVLP